MKPNLPRFDRAAVLTVGDVMLDRYWRGATGRISPEAPVPVINVDDIEDRPGGAANVALNISALGAKSYLAGATGDDENSEILLTKLKAAGVSSNFSKIKRFPTITKLRVMSQNQQLIRLDFEQVFDQLAADAVANSVVDSLNQVQALVLSDYAKGVLQNPQQLIRQAKQNNTPVFVDPKLPDSTRYLGATLLKPNLREFEAMVGPCIDEHDLVAKGQQLIAQCQLQALLITRSEKGMTLLLPGQEEIHYPASAREVYDVTGAGDTVISVMATAMAAGQSFRDAAGLANRASGLVVGKLGTATVTAPELAQELDVEPDMEQGVVTEQQLLVALEQARSRGERIVFTNGCFDILHAGHVGYLGQAKAQADRLIVAINSDESVRKLKGEGRPINTVSRRMTVLAGLAATDWVLSFSQEDPINLLKKIKPDVLVKGGDYDVAGVVGGDFVTSYGGEVKVLSLLEDCSTTAIVEKIRD